MNDTSKVKWHVADMPTLYGAQVSDYETPLEALYELVKNLEDENATEIHIDAYPATKDIYVYGNTEGVSTEKLGDMIRNIGKSEKSDKNFGIGLLSFLRVGRRMIVISRVNQDYNIVSGCIEGGELISDVGHPHLITPAEKTQYLKAINKMRLWNTGCLTLIQDVGCSKVSKFGFEFEFEDQYSERDLEGLIQKKVGFSRLIKNIYFLKYGDGKPYRVSYARPKNALEFAIPSKNHPYVNSKGVKRNLFTQDNLEYEISILGCLGLVHSGSNVMLSCSSQDSCDMKTLLRGTNKLSLGSIFRNSDENKYLTGDMDFVLTCITKPGSSLNVYNSTRNALSLNGAFGECFCNLLQYIEDTVIRPEMDNYISKIKSKNFQKSSEILQDDMEGLFRDNRTFFSEILNTRNLNEVPLRVVKCPACGLQAAPIRCAIYGTDQENDPNRKQKIFAPENERAYICGKCGNRMARREYTTPEWDQPHSTHSNTTPFYKHPNSASSEIGKVRERLRGFGYKFEIAPLSQGDNRPVAVRDTHITVNARHPDYIDIEKEKGKGGELLMTYERMTALFGVIQQECSEDTDLFEKIHGVKALILKRDWKESRKNPEPKHEEVSIDHAVKVQQMAKRLGAKFKVA